MHFHYHPALLCTILSLCLTPLENMALLSPCNLCSSFLFLLPYSVSGFLPHSHFCGSPDPCYVPVPPCRFPIPSIFPLSPVKPIKWSAFALVPSLGSRATPMTLLGLDVLLPTHEFRLSADAKQHYTGVPSSDLQGPHHMRGQEEVTDFF